MPVTCSFVVACFIPASYTCYKVRGNFDVIYASNSMRLSPLTLLLVSVLIIDEHAFRGWVRNEHSAHATNPSHNSLCIFVPFVPLKGMMFAWHASERADLGCYSTVPGTTNCRMRGNACIPCSKCTQSISSCCNVFPFLLCNVLACTALFGRHMLYLTEIPLGRLGRTGHYLATEILVHGRGDSGLG